METTFTGRACGKFILLGDHFVAHGSPALAFPITKLKCEIRLHWPSGEGCSARVKGERAAPFVLHKMNQAFQCALGFFDRQNQLRNASIHSSSNFEMSRGFGSSAAFSVALLRSFLAFRKTRGEGLPEESEIPKILQSLEGIFHLNPSGVDATTIWHEKAVEFTKEKRPAFICNTSADFILADAGERKGTSELGLRVSAYREKHPDRWEQLSRRVHSIIRDCRVLLMAGGRNMAALAGGVSEGHGILTELGLSNPRIESMIQEAKHLGALAGKVSGAGTGGAVVVMTERGRGASLAEKMKDRGIPVVTVVEADEV